MRVLALIAAVCILTAFASAQPEPRFDPKDVVRQVRGVERGASGVERPGLDGGEFLIDTSTALGPALYDQGEPAIAFDGANFLVVWTDYRSSSDIYGARVTPQGTVLDPGGIVISEAADDQSSPAIAFDGTDFLVVWTDERSGSSDVYGARVTPQGAVLDSSGIAISPMAGNQYFPSLVFVGTNFLVVWSDGRAGNSDIYGARVTPQGAVLDPDGFVISQAAYEQRSPALGFDGANFLVVWEDSRSTGPDESDIYGARVTPQGTVLDPDGFVISDDTNYQHSPALGFDGANFLVAWEDSRGGYDWAIYGARVTPQGTVLDPDGFVISEEAYFQQSPALGFDGANFLVAWEDARGGVDWDVYGARITPQGVVLDPDGLVILQAAYGQDTPTLGFDGANFLVAWADGRGGSSDIYGARVTPQGTVLDPSGLAVSQTVYWQWSPAVGFDGTNFLVAWTDERSGSSDIYGARVTPQGTVLDPSG
ncbi:MAG: hypothetical protein NTX53_10670, partial [candidate division WOR-3 bacterium]|nr:hypothetical protein [candidate division WOR-3 bacterium]